MKIVILGPAHPYRGGIAALNDRLAVELIKEGHEVTVFNFSLQYPKFLFPGKTQYTDDPAPRNVTILRKVNAVNPLNWWKVGRELRRLRPELIIVRFWLPFMGPALGTVCRIARRNKYTKVICIADNIIPHEKRIGDVPFTSYFVKGVDGFIAMSQEVFKDLENLCLIRSGVLPPSGLRSLWRDHSPGGCSGASQAGCKIPLFIVFRFHPGI